MTDLAKPSPSPPPPGTGTGGGWRALDIAGHSVPPAAQIGVIALLIALAAYCLVTNRLVRHLGRLLVCLAVAAIAAGLAVGWVDHSKHAMLVLNSASSPAHDWPVLRTLLYAWVALAVLGGFALFTLVTAITRRRSRAPLGLGGGRRRGGRRRPGRAPRRRGRGRAAGPGPLPGELPGMGAIPARPGPPGMSPLDIPGLTPFDLGGLK